MKMRALLIVLSLAALYTGDHAAQAREEHLLRQPAPPAFREEAPPRAPDGFRADTIWFGGHDGSGYAIEGGWWDFEGDGGVGDFQGWTSIDINEDPEVWFSRVTAADFSADPASPIFPGSLGQIWCGVHEEEALERDYVLGMGYGNRMCQRALSPRFAAGDLSVSFDYINDSEDGWDITYLNVLCFDQFGEPVEDGEIELGSFTGLIGFPDLPEFWSGSVAQSTFPAGTDSVCFEFRFVADRVWSDEDGLYNSDSGPFSADNVQLDVGAQSHTATFESGADGYTFDRCEPVGTFMGLIDETTYVQWLETMGVACECELSGWALEFIDEEGSPHPIPGHRVGQDERAISPIVDRNGYTGDLYGGSFADYTQYSFMPNLRGTYYRVGYMYYPYTTYMNPEPHWSPATFGSSYFFTGSQPSCMNSRISFTTGESPVDPDWEKIRVVYDLLCSCEAYGIPSTICEDEGDTSGSPVVDNIRFGLAATPHTPWIVPELGHTLVDGFGQRFPSYLEPGDVGNADIAWDHSPTNVNPDPVNDWLGDSVVVTGPTVLSEEDRFLVELCLRVARKGPWQDLIPDYLIWKARLSGDPESDYVCVLMDSLDTEQGGYNRKFVTYFHENDPGFDPSTPDLSSEQEILPDSVWTPGTVIEYYYRSYYYDGGAVPEEYYFLPTNGRPAEFSILPGMQSVPGSPFEVQWPSVLYLDAFDRGVDYLIDPQLAAIGLEYDKFDYDCGCCWFAPFARSYGGTTYNPGGYGNNGCTLEQLMGYRLLIIDTGTFRAGATEKKDWPMIYDWINSTDCGVEYHRRGLICTGSSIADVLNFREPYGRMILQDMLGARILHGSYRQYSGDEEWCVRLLPTGDAFYEPTLPLTLRGNGCPTILDFDVLGLMGVEDAVGNLSFHDGSTTWDFSSIVRDRFVPGTANWRGAIASFSLSHLSYESCVGAVCSEDSTCVVAAGADWLSATLDWISAGAEPFGLWNLDCRPTGVDGEPGSHLHGPATYLYAARPNPFHRSATVRFSLASSNHVQLHVYDVSGRRVCTLADQNLQGGMEHTFAWDGADDAGRPVGAGVYWLQLSTANGYESGRRMILMR